jgi:hypothetical protein
MDVATAGATWGAANKRLLQDTNMLDVAGNHIGHLPQTIMECKIRTNNLLQTDGILISRRRKMRLTPTT